MKKEKIITYQREILVGIFLIVLLASFVFAADPVGPDSVTWGPNETSSAASNPAQMVNISGGYILSFNLTANTQNPRWKAFVGNVVGSFTLDDASGSTIYNWTVATVTGRIYATRNDSTISWSGIVCANNTTMTQENIYLNQSGADNINRTFIDTTHDLFWVGSNSITANTCPTLNTFVNNNTQDSTFEEIALYDGASHIVYATILESDSTGYDGENYDFQMIVPENGLPSFQGATAYYLYVELGT